MSKAAEPTLNIVVAAAYDDVVRARSTVRTALGAAGLSCRVVDVDGRYRPVADEEVLLLGDVIARLGAGRQAEVAAATLEAEDFLVYAGLLGAAVSQAADGGRVLVLGAGLLMLADPREAVPDAGMVVVPTSDPASVLRRSPSSPFRPLFDRSFVLLDGREQVDQLRSLAASWMVAADATALLAVEVGAGVAPGVLIGPWRAVGPSTLDGRGRLLINGAGVSAVDLSAFDPYRPWLLAEDGQVAPSVLLSKHPALAEFTDAEARARRADDAMSVSVSGPAPDPPRIRVDAALRAHARRAASKGEELPDLLGLGTGPDFETWALTLVPSGHPQPVARYLEALRADRQHLRRAFTAVPGSDAPGLAGWAQRPGAARSVPDPELLSRAASVTLAAQPPPDDTSTELLPSGVNLVGYLSGELGLGESARLVDAALQGAGIATSTYDIAGRLQSRSTADYRRTEPTLHDTTLVCVNGAETAKLAPQLRTFLDRTRVIGMWYWELEELPDSHSAGFEHVDEVWAATEFMREAFAKKSGGVPVRTVTPPLPQAVGDPGSVPEEFGIRTDRAWFLFTFDFLSGADRKNPHGLVDAFTRAFGHLPLDERPQLVIKTINADRVPAQAERLRLQVADRADVVFLDTYLANHLRHVLVAHCTAYVSLHRGEGLGLTIAEAMAWGKPVVTTAYGGVTQFCNEGNALLVEWARGHVEETFGPYEKGMVWAEPDLDSAAALMRSVVEDPRRAAALGAQAAKDIRELHNPAAAGVRMRAALAEGDAQWRTGQAEPEEDAPGTGTGTGTGTGRRWARSGRERLRRMRS